MREMKLYVKVIANGTFCIMEPKDLTAEDYPFDEWKSMKIQAIWLPEKQFKKLPEFQGF